MLKKRIIPIQLLLNGRLVKTMQFGAYRDVGDPVASARVYNSQYADELIVLNINRQSGSIDPLINILDKMSEVCFMPLALGGGIRCLNDATRLITAGADKVILNTVCYSQPSLIREIAECFGSQAVIAAIDARWDASSNRYILYSCFGQSVQSISLEEHIALCIENGVGEIFIQSIDRDGMMQGFDKLLSSKVGALANVPVIICGGAGNYEHLKEVLLETNISAVACGSLFNFSDSNLIRAKAFLSNYQLSFKVV